MKNYFKVMYPKIKTDYPLHLAKYLCERFFGFNKNSILDVGSGTGIIDEYLQIYFSHIVTGIDYPECDLEKDNLPYPDDSFDFVFSKSVIEHIRNYENMLSEIKRVLKPGGKLIIMAPDWKSQYKNYWDDFTHVHPWTAKSLVNCLRAMDYKNVKGELMYQLPFTWKNPYLKIIPKLLSIFPESLKWKGDDFVHNNHRKLIRFSKEKMILVEAAK